LFLSVDIGKGREPLAWFESSYRALVRRNSLPSHYDRTKRYGD